MKISAKNPTTDLDNKIKNTIIKQVESSNENDFLSFSNIINTLLNTYNNIKFINIVGINQIGEQVIYKTSSTDPTEMTKAQVKEFIPEFLNVNRKLENNSLKYCIDIEYIS
jgi:hypothetical protein